MPILTLILANLPAIIQGGTAAWQFISKVREAAQQTGEWNAEHEALFQAQLTVAQAAPQWQPDKS
jgi:hypothetical protein